MKLLIFLLLFVLPLRVQASIDTELQLDHTFGPSSDSQFLAFSPDAKKLAVAGSDGVKIYESATGRVLETRIVSRWHTASVVWSPNGKSLAAGGACVPRGVAGEIIVWRDGQEPLHWTTGKAGIVALAFSPDGTLLASAGAGDIIGESASGSLRLWDARSGRLRKTLANFHAGRAKIAFQNGSKSLALFHSDDRLGRSQTRIFDIFTGKARNAVDSLFDIEKPVANGEKWRLEKFAVAGRDHFRFVALQNRTSKIIVRQDLGPSALTGAFGGPYLAVGSLKHFAIGDITGLTIWKIKGQTPRAVPLRFLGGRTVMPSQITASRDGKTLAIATSRGSLLLNCGQLLRAETKTIRLVPFSPLKNSMSLRFSPSLSLSSDAKRLFNTRWFDLSAPTPRDIRTSSPLPIYGAVALSPDGQILAGTSGNSPGALLLPTAGAAIKLTVPDPSDEQPSGTREINQPSAISWSPDGQRIALIGSANNDDQLFLFDASGHFERELTLENEVLKFVAIAWSPDGKRLLSAARSGLRSDNSSRLDFWDAATGKHQRLIRATTKGVTPSRGIFGQGQFSTVEFSPDGKTFAAGGIVSVNGIYSPQLLVFEEATGQKIAHLPLGSWILRADHWVFLDAGHIALLNGSALEIWDFYAQKRVKSLFLVPTAAEITLIERL